MNAKKHLDNKTEKLPHDLTARLKELSDYIGIVTHDLKEPLTAIKTMITLLHRKSLGQLSQSQEKAVDTIYEATKYMENLVTDLLEISRIEQESTKLKREDIDLNSLMVDVCEKLDFLFEETGANFSCDHLPKVRADKQSITKVFVNLIGNALRYSKKDIPPHIELAVDDADDRWVISVRDNGIGISQEDMSFIFNKFTRGNNVDKRLGTGYGLYIVREIIKRHNGNIWVESSLDKGSTFSFSLPK